MKTALMSMQVKFISFIYGIFKIIVKYSKYFYWNIIFLATEAGQI